MNVMHTYTLVCSKWLFLVDIEKGIKEREREREREREKERKSERERERACLFEKSVSVGADEVSCFVVR